MSDPAPKTPADFERYAYANFSAGDGIAKEWETTENAILFRRGYCHVLALAAQEVFPDLDLEIVKIVPVGSEHGYHVYARAGDIAVDSRGFRSPVQIEHEWAALKQKDAPGWNFQTFVLERGREREDPIIHRMMAKDGYFGPDRDLYGRARAFVLELAEATEFRH